MNKKPVYKMWWWACVVITIIMFAYLMFLRSTEDKEFDTAYNEYALDYDDSNIETEESVATVKENTEKPQVEAKTEQQIKEELQSKTTSETKKAAPTQSTPQDKIKQTITKRIGE